MSERMVVLDACAVIALQRGEDGADQVRACLTDPQVEVIVHAINLCEVYYDAVRRDSSVELHDLWTDLKSSESRWRRSSYMTSLREPASLRRTGGVFRWRIALLSLWPKGVEDCS